MISAYKIVQKFKYSLDQGWGYIYGSSGEIWTQSNQNSATRQQTVKWGKRWIGKRVADCSGLFVWAFKQLGGYMYHGSNTMFKKYSTSKGKLEKGKRDDGEQLKIGSAVYKYSASDGYHHVGLYTGNDTVIQAKGTYYGVVTSNISEWDCWSELIGVNYDCNDEDEKEKILMKAKVTTTSGSLNLRKEKSTSSQKICSIPNGSIVDVYDNSGDWWRIEYELDQGYAMAKYLTLQSEAVTISSLEQMIKKNEQRIVAIQKKIDQLINTANRNGV